MLAAAARHLPELARLAPADDESLVNLFTSFGEAVVALPASVHAQLLATVLASLDPPTMQSCLASTHEGGFIAATITAVCVR